MLRRRSFVAFAILVCSIVAGCGAAREEGKPTLTIYVSAPLSGPAAGDGQDIADGARLALADAGDKAGGVDVRVRYLDDAKGATGDARFDSATVAANARMASEDSASIAYVGELDSGATRTSLPITNNADILQVSPGSGASDLVKDKIYNDDVPTQYQTTGKRTFATLVPSDERQGTAAARLLRRAPGTGSFFLSDGSPFVFELLTGLKDLLPDAHSVTPAQGPLLVKASQTHDGCDYALASVETLRRVRYYPGRPVANPRIFLASEPACAFKVLAAMRGAGVTASIVSSDALLEPKALAALALAGGGTLTSATEDPGQLPEAGKRMLKRFRDRFRRAPGRYAAYGYEAMASVLAAIDRANDATSRDDVIDAYFDGTKRDSVLGRYSIDEIGQSSLPLGKPVVVDGPTGR